MAVGRWQQGSLVSHHSFCVRHVPGRHHKEEEGGGPAGPRRVEGRGL